MDLKRAWRNGFLAPLLIAAPLYDLSLGEIKYLIAESHAQKQSASLATGVSVDANLATSNDDAAGDPNRFVIPEQVLRSLLGSADPAIDDGRDAALQFDPQDLFDSAGGPGDGFEELTDDVQQFADARHGSGTPLSIAFASPFAANGIHSPHSPRLFTAGGGSGSDGGSDDSAEGTAGTLLADPSTENPTQSDTDSPQTVPEPSSLMLLAIGAIAVALLVHRKSRIPTRS